MTGYLAVPDILPALARGMVRRGLIERVAGTAQDILDLVPH